MQLPHTRMGLLPGQARSSRVSPSTSSAVASYCLRPLFTIRGSEDLQKKHGAPVSADIVSHPVLDRKLCKKEPLESNLAAPGGYVMRRTLQMERVSNLKNLKTACISDRTCIPRKPQALPGRPMHRKSSPESKTPACCCLLRARNEWIDARQSGRR